MNMNFLKLIKNAQKIQESMQKKQEELAKITVEGEAGAGAVKVLMNTRHYIQKIEISDEVANESKEILADLIAAAINQATEKVEQITKEEMMNMEGMKDMLGGGSLNDLLGGKQDSDK